LQDESSSASQETKAHAMEIPNLRLAIVRHGVLSVGLLEHQLSSVHPVAYRGWGSQWPAFYDSGLVSAYIRCVVNRL